MPIPAGDLTLLRSTPQTSDLFLVIQQSEFSTDDGATWTGYDWSCRIDGAHTDDPTVTLAVDGGAAATDILDGMTILIGSSKYGDWDHGIYRVRGDQTVDGATIALDIGTSSEVRGNVTDDDYVVVLDEFRFWQRFGRITAAGGAVVWYKDYDIAWGDIGATDAISRLAMMPPVPIMGPHAVKFVEIGGTASTFYFDWQDSYAPAVGETVATWASEGEQDHAGTTWNSAAETPGWQTTDTISGLRGFRVTLAVDDGNGNAATLPYRRGVRYVFTLRRPGETQVGDPDNAEPITNFSAAPPTASFDQGYWRTSITVFESEASKYNIMPGALAILFTDDVYGTTAGSLGPITDRENILMVGRIVDGTIRENPETGDVTFDVESPGAETALYHNYPIVVQNNDLATTWIDTPDLTVDRAIHYYTTWHTTLNIVADLYQIGSATEIFAQDFLEGDIYSTLNQFMSNRLFARLLCDKYGRFHCEVDAQEQAFGAVTTQWTMQRADWLEEATVRQRLPTPVNAAECGGLIYNEGGVIPKLSHAPGLFDKYRGARQAATSLAITTQAALNTSCGRHLSALNYENEIDFLLTGNWRYCDIAPQRVVDIGTLATDRESLTGTYIIREVSNGYDPSAGVIFTEIRTQQEAGDGVAGVTIDIPENLPTPTRQPPHIPILPGLPPLPGWPAAGTGRRIIATDVGVFVTDGITAVTPVWYGANNGFVTAADKVVWSIARDPFHWWTSGGTERTLWCVSQTGVWKHENFPYGTWVQQLTETDFLNEFAFVALGNSYLQAARISMSIEDDGRYVVGFSMDEDVGFPFGSATTCCACVCQAAAISNGNEFYSNPPAHDPGWCDVRFNPLSASQIVYANPCRYPNHVVNARRELFRSANGGGAWAAVDGPYTFGQINGYGSLSVPYGSGGTSVFWASNLVRRVSTDSGSVFGDVPGIAAVAASILGTSDVDDRLLSATDRPSFNACSWSIDSGANWTALPVMPVDIQTYSSWSFWQGDSFRNLLLGGVETGANPGPSLIYSHDAGAASWDDKGGNLAALGVGIVYDIDRDSMGSA